VKPGYFLLSPASLAPRNAVARLIKKTAKAGITETAPQTPSVVAHRQNSNGEII
jgi:hypothetical protein